MIRCPKCQGWAGIWRRACALLHVEPDTAEPDAMARNLFLRLDDGGFTVLKLRAGSAPLAATD
ncbi:MAG: hypothetical protein WB801_10905 [Candidatus Dormiibacterota bacterium]